MNAYGFPSNFANISSDLCNLRTWTAPVLPAIQEGPPVFIHRQGRRFLVMMIVGPLAGKLSDRVSDFPSAFMSEICKTSGNVLKETAPACRPARCDADIDIALLEDNLAKTPWERMLANDDALNLAESLRAAMEKRDAES